MIGERILVPDPPHCHVTCTSGINQPRHHSIFPFLSFFCKPSISLVWAQYQGPPLDPCFYHKVLEILTIVIIVLCCKIASGILLINFFWDRKHRMDRGYLQGFLSGCRRLFLFADLNLVLITNLLFSLFSSALKTISTWRNE